MTIEKFLRIASLCGKCSVSCEGFHRFKVFIDADYRQTIYIVPLSSLEEGIDGSEEGGFGKIADVVEGFYDRNQEAYFEADVKIINPNTNKSINFKILKDVECDKCLFVWRKNKKY